MTPNAQGADAPGDVGRQLEARGVRDVDVLECEGDRRVAGDVLDELDRRLGHPRPFELRRAGGTRGVRGAAEPFGQGGGERASSSGQVAPAGGDGPAHLTFDLGR